MSDDCFGEDLQDHDMRVAAQWVRHTLDLPPHDTTRRNDTIVDGCYWWRTNQTAPGDFLVAVQREEENIRVIIRWPDPEDIHDDNIDTRPLYAIAGWCQRWGHPFEHQNASGRPAGVWSQPSPSCGEQT